VHENLSRGYQARTHPKDPPVPTKSKKPCSVPGCPTLTQGRWCEKHTKNKFVARGYDQLRGSSSERGYDSQWKRTRLIALQRDNYLCQECLKVDRPTQAQEVHHLLGIDIRPDLRLDVDNLSSVCAPCHKRITAEEQGIFGRTATNKNKPA
jgi:5-methylcytosine-specific restriction protein A